MRRRLLQAAVVLALFGALWWNQERGIQSLASESHSALCAFKRDIEQRRDRSVEYLEEHPRGLVSSSGEVILSRLEIQRSIDAQNSTLAALDELRC